MNDLLNNFYGGASGTVRIEQFGVQDNGSEGQTLCNCICRDPLHQFGRFDSQILEGYHKKSAFHTSTARYPCTHALHWISLSNDDDYDDMKPHICTKERRNFVSLSKKSNDPSNVRPLCRKRGKPLNYVQRKISQPSPLATHPRRVLVITERPRSPGTRISAWSVLR